MENKNKNLIVAKKKILSILCLIVFSLAFIFACLKNMLPLGGLIVGTFGYLTYPLFFVLILIELAKILGLKYNRSTKKTIYLLFLIFSLLFAIQAISTYKTLDKVVNFSSLKKYLSYSYDIQITLTGAFGSIFIGAFSILFGAMGTIVAYIIIFTISVGLIVDYENYGKFEDENIKKLKTKALREKVAASDKHVTSSGEPDFGFNRQNDVIDSIEVNENEINLNNNIVDNNHSYSQNDVVGEIFDESLNEPIDSGFGKFSSNEDDENTIARRNFMSGTFGCDNNQNYSTPNFDSINSNDYNLNNYSNNDYSNNNYSNNDVSTQDNLQDGQFNFNSAANYSDSNFGGSSFDFNSNNENAGLNIDDDVKNILTQKEVDIGEFSSNQGAEPVSSTPFNNISNLNSGISNFEQFKPVSQFEQRPFSQTAANMADDWKVRNSGIMPEPKPQSKPAIKPVVPTAVPTAMTGIRYNPPPLSLLRKPVPDTGNYSEEQSRKSKLLEDVLSSFNIPAKVVNIVRGPKITRYELSLPYGVPVKRIPNYELDIQRSLEAKTITIKAPIPGSQYVGIELENDTYTSVYERELLASDEFQNSKDPLPIAVGKDISGEIIVKSLAKMVHLLIAGSTGSGKSVFIHNIVMSLIYKYSPDDLRLILIDPKKVEFNIYNGLPHLITPEVVMGADKAINALKWCVKEMDRRYTLMQKASYNNIEPYNKSELVKAGQFEHLPYIVIIVDELAEIMLANKKESEVCIQRITQLARACGMHLVLATQRPSVDIISGVIKNNIPSRIAFSLQSGIDSKTILNAVGAEKLLGQGDMIFAPTGTSATPRLQAAYATDEEIRSVIDFDIKNNKFNYDSSIETEFNAEPQQADSARPETEMVDELPTKGSVDSYFKVAVKSVMINGNASVSYLQRRLGIGYARAAKIIDQMEERGYVAPPTGSKQRKVFITPEQFREEFGEDYNS